MATTYRATSPAGNIVAVKILSSRHAKNVVSRRRFETEIALGVSLNHPNIVRVIDYGLQEDMPFIVMDYIAGDSLERRLRSQPLSPDEFLPVLVDVSRALDHAHFVHKLRVVHRDIKPANILLRSDGRAMLADFGIAKLEGMTAFTATDARIGSVYYMSPEQAGGALELTPASDVYSLGVTTFHALTGRQPFTGEHEIAIARMQMDNPPPHLCEVNPSVPKAICSVVLSALEKSPTKRPASAGEFMEAFRRALEQSKTEFAGDKYHSLPTIKPVPIVAEAIGGSPHAKNGASTLPPPILTPSPVALNNAVAKPAPVIAGVARRWPLWLLAGIATLCATLGASTTLGSQLWGRIGLFNRGTPTDAATTAVPIGAVLTGTVLPIFTASPVVSTPLLATAAPTAIATRKVVLVTVVAEPSATNTPRAVPTTRPPIFRPTRMPTRRPIATATPAPNTPAPPPALTPTAIVPATSIPTRAATATPIRSSATPVPIATPTIVVTRPPATPVPPPVAPVPHPVPLPTRTPRGI